MSSVATRVVAAVVLACWVSPGVEVLGLGLHLALERHCSRGAEHWLEISDLARAASHGHRHDTETAPDHDHEARVDGFFPDPRPGASSVEVLPASTSLGVALAERSPLGGMPRRGSPLPLFTVHCSLLL